MKTSEPALPSLPTISAPLLVTEAGWTALKRFTDARIALGRSGHSLPTAAHLNFQLAHAQARDAVHVAFDPTIFESPLKQLGLETLQLNSAAPDRQTYLLRPDLGRKLDADSRRLLEQRSEFSHDGNGAKRSTSDDLVAFVIADGLSAQAVHENAVPLITAMVARLGADTQAPWKMAPVALVHQGRVAVGDEVGQLSGAKIVVVLIGERPGLSSPDSMGIYITWDPRVGLDDSRRNCISNVRSAGLSVQAAAEKLHYLLNRSRVLGLTGVDLKDESESPTPIGDATGTQDGLNKLVWNRSDQTSNQDV